MDTTTPQPGTEAANPDDAQKVSASTTTFGFASYGLPTPKWAGAVFDLYFIISKALIGWFAATKLISPELLMEGTFFITLFLDPVVKGLTKMFGVQINDGK